MQKSLEAMCVRAKNKRVLAALNRVDDNVVECIKSKYKPHCIIWAKGVEISSSKSELELIMEIHESFPYIRLIVNLGSDVDNIYDTLVGNEIYDVVKRTITDVEFIKLLNEPLTSCKDVDRFNEVKHKAVATKQKKKFIVNPLAITLLAVVVGIVAACFVLKNITASSDVPSKAATKPSGTIEIQTETVTEQAVAATEKYTEYAVAATQAATAKPTEKVTEKATQKPTEKATEKKKSISTSGGNNSNNSSSGNINGGAGGNSGNTVQQPVQQAEQPIQQMQPVVQQPVQQPVAEQQQQITDDGQIHFDKDSYTVSIGETFDIYVTGLAAASGCNWNLTNNAIAEFVSSDVTKVTLKAKAKGSTIITGTAKSNGASRQVLVTVE